MCVTCVRNVSLVQQQATYCFELRSTDLIKTAEQTVSIVHNSSGRALPLLKRVIGAKIVANLVSEREPHGWMPAGQADTVVVAQAAQECDSDDSGDGEAGRQQMPLTDGVAVVVHLPPE